LNDEHLTEMLKTAVDECGLDVNNVTAAHSDGNTSVNYGRKILFAKLHFIKCQHHILTNPRS